MVVVEVRRGRFHLEVPRRGNDRSFVEKSRRRGRRRPDGKRRAERERERGGGGSGGARESEGERGNTTGTAREVEGGKLPRDI